MARSLLTLALACLLPLAAPAQTPPPIQSQTCSDIRTFDFKNATLHLSPDDQNELKGLFNEPYAFPFYFHLHNGVGFISDDGGFTQQWKETLLDDRPLHPEPATWLRLIVLQHEHLKGTGTWRYVLIFRCEDQLLLPIFQFNSEGTRVEHLDDHGFQLSQTIWSPSDPHDAPSKHRELSYQWSPREHRYLRTHVSPSADVSSPRP